VLYASYIPIYIYKRFFAYVWHFDWHSPKEPLHAGTKDERDGNKRFVTRKAFAGAV